MGRLSLLIYFLTFCFCKIFLCPGFTASSSAKRHYYYRHYHQFLLFQIHEEKTTTTSGGCARSSIIPEITSVEAEASTTTKVYWKEVKLDPPCDDDLNEDTTTTAIGERVKQGDSVILLAVIVDEEECQYIVQACTEKVRQDHSKSATTTCILEKQQPGLVRLPTIAAAARAAATQTPCAEPVPENVNEQLQEILLRVCRHIDEHLPSLVTTLFDTDSLSDLLMMMASTNDEMNGIDKSDNDRLHFSSREPAVNVYTAGGEFLAHKDAQALTVLLPLSCPQRGGGGCGDFTGGGTAFWSQDSRGHQVKDPTTVILKPTGGTAMLFGGHMTHAGMPVVSGTRVVFVASFSRTGNKPKIHQHRDIYGDAA